jgi:hypothetical protein
LRWAKRRCSLLETKCRRRRTSLRMPLCCTFLRKRLIRASADSSGFKYTVVISSTIHLLPIQSQPRWTVSPQSTLSTNDKDEIPGRLIAQTNDRGRASLLGRETFQPRSSAGLNSNKNSAAFRVALQHGREPSILVHSPWPWERLIPLDWLSKRGTIFLTAARSTPAKQIHQRFRYCPPDLPRAKIYSLKPCLTEGIIQVEKHLVKSVAYPEHIAKLWITFRRPTAGQRTSLAVMAGHGPATLGSVLLHLRQVCDA